MLINFKTLCQKYSFIPKGIIHIGAHKAEEYDIYSEMGVQKMVWVEANPNLFEYLKLKFNGKQDIQCYSYIITDQDNQQMTFYITNNGESSSILKMGTHTQHHPHIQVTGEKVLLTKRMDSLIKENNIPINNYDFINLDIQGAELLALKSFGELLSNFKYIYTEVNDEHLYENCCLIGEIDDYVKQFGFERVETSMTEYKWGDALYIKK
jgi:FkbM family methyltransferase